jgi:hypothetical protein
MEQLTATQAKMVIEFFAGQAAEDAPFTYHGMNEALWETFYKHEWKTRLQLSLLLEREVNDHDWHTLISTMIDWQVFDRDPAGYLNARGHEDTEQDRDYMHGVLEDLVSWAIDSVHNTAKANW